MKVTIDRHELHNGDCFDVLKAMPDASVHAVVTDPPYGLGKEPDALAMLRDWLDVGHHDIKGRGFMGKEWDAFIPQPALWREVLRVLKPGGHLVAFAGSRTVDLMGLALRIAGFEVRDSLVWMYGSGFPKSLDVSKAIDRKKHVRSQVLRVTAWVRDRRDALGLTNADLDAPFGFAGMGRHWTTQASQPAVPTLEQIPQLLSVLQVTLEEVPEDIRDLIWTLNGPKGQPGPNWFAREVTGQHAKAATAEIWHANLGMNANTIPKERRDNPATEQAARWQGWGTALKPAMEPIVLARKPLAGTVASNVQVHGTGALNIDGCRIEYQSQDDYEALSKSVQETKAKGGSRGNSWANKSDLSGANDASTLGRWPANVLLDEAAAAMLDTQTGERGGGFGVCGGDPDGKGIYGSRFPRGDKRICGYGDTGGASRFFYTSKASRSERDDGCDDLPELSGGQATGRQDDSAGTKSPRAGAGRTGGARNFHPTVKPTDLMRWLVRLITPEQGVVLDPFMGSGSTGIAAHLERARFIGIERERDYFPIAVERIKAATRQGQLF